MPGEAHKQGAHIPTLKCWSGEGKEKIETCGWDSGSAIAGSNDASTACVRGGSWKWRRTNRVGVTKAVEALSAERRTSKHAGGGKDVE